MAKCQIHNNFLANVATHFLITAVIFLPPGIEPTLLASHLFEGPLWGRFTDWAIETAAQTVMAWSASLCSATLPRLSWKPFLTSIFSIIPSFFGVGDQNRFLRKTETFVTFNLKSFNDDGQSPSNGGFHFYLSFSRGSSGGGFKRKAAAGSTDVRHKHKWRLQPQQQQQLQLELGQLISGKVSAG